KATARSRLPRPRPCCTAFRARAQDPEGAARRKGPRAVPQAGVPAERAERAQRAPPRTVRARALPGPEPATSVEKADTSGVADDCSEHRPVKVLRPRAEYGTALRGPALQRAIEAGERALAAEHRER